MMKVFYLSCFFFFSFFQLFLLFVSFTFLIFLFFFLPFSFFFFFFLLFFFFFLLFSFFSFLLSLSGSFNMTIKDVLTERHIRAIGDGGYKANANFLKKRLLHPSLQGEFETIRSTIENLFVDLVGLVVLLGAPGSVLGAKFSSWCFCIIW